MCEIETGSWSFTSKLQDEHAAQQGAAADAAKAPRLGFFDGPERIRSLSPLSKEEKDMKRVDGIGGIFFNSPDPVTLRAWYKEHLGIDVQDRGGAAFTWTDLKESRQRELPFGLSASSKQFL